MRRTHREQMSSGLAPTADIDEQYRRFRDVPAMSGRKQVQQCWCRRALFGRAALAECQSAHGHLCRWHARLKQSRTCDASSAHERGARASSRCQLCIDNAEGRRRSCGSTDGEIAGDKLRQNIGRLRLGHSRRLCIPSFPSCAAFAAAQSKSHRPPRSLAGS